MPEADVNADLLQVILDIRQEIEDMAYDKLRCILSDFSLVGMELDQKIEEHKLIIKENVREIVQRRLNERQIRITEEEFWCICGKYKRPYAEIHLKRPPLIEVKKVVSPIDLIIQTSTIDLGVIPEEMQKHNVSEKSIDQSLIISVQREDSLLEAVPISLMDQIDQPDADITSLISSGDEKSIHEPIPTLNEDNLELDKSLRTGQTKKMYGSYSKPPSEKDKSIKKIKDKARIMRQGSTELQVVHELQGQEEFHFGDSEGMLYSRDLGEISSTNIEKMKQEHFEYYEEEDSQEFIGNIFGDDRTKRMVSQRDVVMSLYGEAFYEYFEDKQDIEEYDWIRYIINQLIDMQHVRAISDLLQEKYNELHGPDEPGKTFHIKTDMLEASSLDSSTTKKLSMEEFSEDDLEYLQRSFGSLLQMALAEVTIKKPSSPLAYIAQYLQFSKLGDNFDKSKREACEKIADAQNKIEDGKRRLYWQRKKMIQNGREIDKYLTILDDNYKFNTHGKVTLRRGRRIRKDIVTICDSMLVKTPLYKLAKKIKRLYAFKKTLSYAKILLQNLIRETTLIKYDTTIGIYNTLVRFLNPILPQMQEIRGSIFSSSFVSTFSADSKDTAEKVSARVITVDVNAEVENIFRNVDVENVHEFRGGPSCYPCMKHDIRHPYHCKRGSKCFDNAKFDKIKDILSMGCNSITQMIYIDRDEAYRMCEHIPNIIKKMLDDHDQIKSHLNEFITDSYMSISLKSMYDEHYEYMIAIKRQDLLILEDVKKIIDRALEFEFANDLALVKEAMFRYINTIITKQQTHFKKFTEDEKALAVQKFKSGVKTLVNAAQSDVSQHPCDCAEANHDVNSEQSWSDDEDGILDAREQKRLNKIMRRVAATVEKLAMKERNIATIENLLDVFITRAHRQPRINKRTLWEINEFLDSIAGIFEKKQIVEELLDTPNLTMDAEDGYICADTPCVCKYILQVSALLISIHSRMLRRSDELRKAERDELELGIMKMFASLVDGLTLDKIQKQNLCSSNF